MPVATVTGGGWTECYRDTYAQANNGAAWSAAQAGCAGARLMMACRPTGSSTIQLLAQAPRADVLTDTGLGNTTTTHNANGTAWYWNGGESWGFAAQGDSVRKYQCDTEGSGDNAARLCWHSVNPGVGGFRCGADAGLNDTTPFERILYAPAGPADLAITKTDGVTSVTAGGSLTYTVTASNAGPDPVTGATVADTLPAVLTDATWTCVGAGGGTCTAAGSGNLNDTVNLPLGGTVTYTLTATVSATATGTLSNTATIAAPAGVIDPDPANNSATDTDTITQGGNLTVTLTGTAGPVAPGAAVSYTLTATNPGPSAATGVVLASNFPAPLRGLSWTCVGAAGGSCTAAGTGAVADTVNLPPGASVVYAVSGTVDLGAAPGSVTASASLMAPAGFVDPDPDNNAATATTAIVAAAPVPTQSALALALLALLTALGGGWAVRRRNAA